MKRDMELIRKILLAVEDSESAFAPDPLIIEGYTDEQITYHSYLLVNAGLVHGHISIESGESLMALVEYPTWDGHEFLDAARDDARWKKTMHLVAEKGGAVTMSVLQGLLVAGMKSAFGLP